MTEYATLRRTHPDCLAKLEWRCRLERRADDAAPGCIDGTSAATQDRLQGDEPHACPPLRRGSFVRARAAYMAVAEAGARTASASAVAALRRDVKTAFRPLLSSPRVAHRWKADLLIIVPTVARDEGVSYLAETLTALSEGLATSDDHADIEVRVVVFNSSPHHPAYEAVQGARELAESGFIFVRNPLTVQPPPDRLGEETDEGLAIQRQAAHYATALALGLELGFTQLMFVDDDSVLCGGARSVIDFVQRSPGGGLTGWGSTGLSIPREAAEAALSFVVLNRAPVRCETCSVPVDLMLNEFLGFETYAPYYMDNRYRHRSGADAKTLAVNQWNHLGANSSFRGRTRGTADQFSCGRPLQFSADAGRVLSRRRAAVSAAPRSNVLRGKQSNPRVLELMAKKKKASRNNADPVTAAGMARGGGGATPNEAVLALQKTKRLRGDHFESRLSRQGG